MSIASRKKQALKLSLNNMKLKSMQNGAASKGDSWISAKSTNLELFTSQAQGEAAQQRLVRLQQEGAKLQQEAQQKMLKAQEKFNKTLRDSVQSFLKDYNKDMHFDMIISKQGDNVLYANEKLDITREVVNGMNKRYQSK